MQENSKLSKSSKPSFKDMNSLIAKSLLSVFFPAANSPTSKLSLWSSQLNSLQNTVKSLCPNPAFKLLQLRSIPQCDTRTKAYNADLWGDNGIVQRMRQMIITNSNEHLINWSPHKIVKSLANLLVLRGDKVYDERTTLEEDLFGKKQSFYSSNPLARQTSCLVSVRDSHRLFGNQKSVGLLSNN